MTDPVLAFRLAGHRLTAPAATVEEAAAGWTLQDSPPGALATALLARVPGLAPGTVERALEEERTLVAVYNARSATAVVPAGDLRAFGAAHLPADEAGLRHVLLRAVPPDADPADAVERTVAVVREALDAGPRSRDQLHQALREGLPGALLPWCGPCGTHHARRGLLIAACLRGELCLAGRAGRQPAFARPVRWLPELPPAPDPGEALAALGRRFLHRYGPARPAALAGWAGLPKPHARRAFELLAPELEEGPDGVVLAADAPRLADPPAHRGVTLLPPGDPLLQDRDRERLVPDPAARRALWTASGSPGAVLADGAVAGPWRARRKGTTLEVATDVADDRLQAAADALAPLRGCRRAVLP